VDDDAVRTLAYEISLGADAGTPEENWHRAQREFAVVHQYDTADRDLERLEVTLSRLPSEAGVQWRLTLPRGERMEAWETGTNGLSPPSEVMRLIGGVLAGKELIPGPPASAEAGAVRLRTMLEAQRTALLAHDPGVRLGTDPENLHQHRVAARRARAFLRAARRYLDPDYQRSLGDALRRLGEATGPVRDLDVVLERIQQELERLDAPDRLAVESIIERLRSDRDTARRTLLEELDGLPYQLVLSRLGFPPRLAAGVDAVPLERIARRELRRLASTIGRLGKQPEEAEIHRLRIAVKRARYAAVLAELTGKAGARFLKDARVLQDLLGEHQDAIVTEQRLRTAAVRDDATAVAFAAGQVAERQRAIRADARERLPAAWKRLRKSAARLV